VSHCIVPAQELVFKLANAMDKTLIFKTGKIDEFETRLKQLASQLDGFSRSFQCTCTLARADEGSLFVILNRYPGLC